MSDLIEEVKNMLIEELNLESIEDGAKQEDYPEWDSLTYLRVIAAIESTFEVEVTRENINKFNSIENIVHEIKKCRNNS